SSFAVMMLSIPHSYTLLPTELSAPEICAVSLHDALPISRRRCRSRESRSRPSPPKGRSVRSRAPRGHRRGAGGNGPSAPGCRNRSEEHTSELQSRENLVCRLLLEKK